MPLTAWDVAVAVRTAYGEARGESPAGREAIFWVMRNRATDAAARWPTKLARVCLQRHQFSAWDDFNRDLMASFEEGAQGYDGMRSSLLVVWAASSEEDPTKGANAYLTVGEAHARPPDWYDVGKITVTIGNHVFLRL